MAPPPPTTASLAASLDMSEAQLREFAASPPYERWRVRKRGGKWRQISTPASRLKEVQRWILRNVTATLPVHDAAHGCRSGRSIVTNAMPHAGVALLVKADIADFFGMVTRARVVSTLRTAGLEPPVADLIADLCTAHVWGGLRSLPQGAPTSPSLANAVCLRLDHRLVAVAAAAGARYTRYVDDLTFSLAGPGDPAALLLEVRRVVCREGFRLNPAKTAIEPANGRQTVTGLVTNDRPRPRRDFLRRLRAAVHRGAKGRELERLRGLIAFVAMSDPKRGEALRKQLEEGNAT